MLTQLNPSSLIIISIMLASLPLAFGLLTSFVKLSVVLGIIKNALGTQHAPSAMVTLALSFALTLTVMNPVVEKTIELSKNIDIQSFEKMSIEDSFKLLAKLSQPWREFILKNSGGRELAYLSLALEAQSDLGPQQPSFRVLIAAFLITELKEGFSMAFIVLLPFLALDLIVANLLMGLGMMMMSPVMISLPLKLILFVVSDAWLIIIQALIRSYI